MSKMSIELLIVLLSLLATFLTTNSTYLRSKSTYYPYSHYDQSSSYNPFSPYTSGLSQQGTQQQPSYWTYQPTTGLQPPTYGSYGSPGGYRTGPPMGTSQYGYGYSSYPNSYTSTSTMSIPSTGYGSGSSYGTPTSYQQALYGHYNYGQQPYRDYHSYYPSSSQYYKYQTQPSYSSWPSYPTSSQYPSYGQSQYGQSYNPYQVQYNPYQQHQMYGRSNPWMSYPGMQPPMQQPGLHYPGQPGFPFGSDMPRPRTARATIKGNPGTAVDGIIEFLQMSWGGVKVKGRIYGVPGGPSTKGLHILNSKSCPEILPVSQTIEHFNPLKSPTHGPPGGPFKHAGDLGNVFVNYDGSCIFEFTSSQISLTEPNSIVNRSLIITEWADDMGMSYNPESRKTGNSGKAIACGIIKLSMF